MGVGKGKGSLGPLDLEIRYLAINFRKKYVVVSEFVKWIFTTVGHSWKYIFATHAHKLQYKVDLKPYRCYYVAYASAS